MVATGRSGLAEDLVRGLGIPADRVEHVRQVELAAVGDRLAGIDRLGDGELIRVLLDEVGEREEHALAVCRVDPAPVALVERRPGGGDSTVHIGLTAGRDVGDDLTRRGRETLEGRSVDGIDECAVDIGLGADRVGEGGSHADPFDGGSGCARGSRACCWCPHCRRSRAPMVALLTSGLVGSAETSMNTALAGQPACTLLIDCPDAFSVARPEARPGSQRNDRLRSLHLFRTAELLCDRTRAPSSSCQA